MRIPFFSTFHALDKAPRRFLLFVAFNVVSWQCIVGPAMVLLARKIEMPPTWVGFLISFLPLSQVLVAGTVPLVTRLGPKRVMLTAWLFRNLVVCAVFLLPITATYWGQKPSWYVLIFGILGFCVLRALGSGGWLPWLHEVVPERQRGLYFSAEATVTQFLSILISLGQAVILTGSPSINDYLFIFGIGVVSGMVSLLWMYRVPGGRPTAYDEPFEKRRYSYRTVIQNRAFLWFVIMVSLCYSCTTWYGAALVLFMRDILHLDSKTIMILFAFGSASVLLTIRAWGRFADHGGSTLTMVLSMIGFGFAPLACLAIVPGTSWVMYLLFPSVIVSSIFGASFWLASHRGMLYHVKAESRVVYTNVWAVGTALALGFTPILVGAIVDHFHLAGFRFCFAVSGIAGLACAVATYRITGENREQDYSLDRLINPVLPILTLARIVWITAGLHPSNRRGEERR